MDKEKLSELIAYLKGEGLTQTVIASRLGVSQPYVNALLTGKKDFGKKQAQVWREMFGLSPSWLLTGEGPMLVGDLLTGERGSEEDDEGNWARIRENPDEGQPYYDIDFLGGYGEFIDNPEDAHPEYFIDFKPYNRKGVFYVNLRGDSMAPEFNGGDLLALRPVEGWWEYLLLGKVYAIVTKQGQRTIKRLRKGTSPESYLLEPINPSYDTQDIPKDQIAAVFEVLGGIRHYE